MSRKITLVNLLANITSVLVNSGIAFFLTPFIVGHMGNEAYSFVNIIGSFVSYFAIVTISLNSLSARFIAIEAFKGDVREANRFYSSNFYANVFIAIIMLIPAFFMILFVDKLFNVSPGLVRDVQWLMGFMFINFFIGLLTTNLGVSFFLKNKLYLASRVNIESNLMRMVITIILFSCFKAHIAYVGLAWFIVTVYTAFMNLYYKRKLLPEMQVSRADFMFSKIKTLVFAGIWNVVNRLGTLLLDSLDLWIANRLIGKDEAGVLAISKTVPSIINTASNSLIVVFAPKLTDLFAKGDVPQMLSTAKRSMKIMGAFTNVPVALVAIFGDIFYRLWQPTQDARLLQILSLIAIAAAAVTGPVNIVNNIFTVMNKIKVPSTAIAICGVINFIAVITVVKTTSLGLFAIAGISTILEIVRSSTVSVIYASKCLKCKWYEFYPAFAKSIVSFGVVCGIGFLLRHFVTVNSWLGLIGAGCIVAVLGFGFNAFFVLDKPDRQSIFRRILRKRASV